MAAVSFSSRDPRGSASDLALVTLPPPYMNVRGSLTDLSAVTEAEIEKVLDGRRPLSGARLLFAGPAVVASIAYMDPGNFATNLQAGAKYGYSLLWVVLLANLIAMLFQGLSAKLGIVTGRNLAELCREYFPAPIVFLMWIVSEIAAMATDLAEFLGGAIALSLIFHTPLFVGMVVTALVTYGVLLADRGGFRPIELIIGALVSVIALCYLAELFIVHTAWGAVAEGTLVPSLPGNGALLIAVGILGATVMPHAIFLHSSLTQARGRASSDSGRRKLIRLSNVEVVIALLLAGLVNMAMVIMASSAFHSGHPEIAEIQTAYHILTPLLGAGAAIAFLISLVASGISSSVVGTMAGQMIMQGFIGFHTPVWLRRLVTMIPALIVVAMGVDATEALVYSQVLLSLALPVPMLALIFFTSRRATMRDFVNHRLTTVIAIFGAAVILVLNIYLVLQLLDLA